MRLFDRFRSTPPPPDDENNEPGDAPSPAQDDYEAAQALAAQNEPAKALSHLTGGFEKDAAFRPLYELAAQCLRDLSGEDEAVLFDAALADFQNHKPFFDLGYHFIDVDHYRLAVPFLERAHLLAPGDALVASELAIAYTHQFQPQRGRDALQDVYQTASFWAAYQYFWCCLLCNSDLDEIADFVADGRNALAESNLSEEDLQGPAAALDKMERCLERLLLLGEDLQPQLVRDWHFIQYGAALLDFFDDRTDENGLQVAGGRYVALWGSLPSIAGILHKLVRFLEALDRKPERLLYLPERDSEIIGIALGTLLNLPPEEADETNIVGPDRLIVAADNRLLDDWRPLYLSFPNQTVFALNVHWTEDGSVTPDAGGLMTQTYYFPWRGEGITIDPETRETIPTPPDTRPSFEIAAELAATEGELDMGFDAEHLPFYVHLRDHLAGAPSITPPSGERARLRFNSDSPVPGAYFY